VRFDIQKRFRTWVGIRSRQRGRVR
jgi:hypothetical protein